MVVEGTKRPVMAAPFRGNRIFTPGDGGRQEEEVRVVGHELDHAETRPVTMAARVRALRIRGTVWVERMSRWNVSAAPTGVAQV